MSLTWGQFGNRLIAMANEKKIPISGQFELTSRCNLQCKMCYVCSPINDATVISRELSAKQWIKLAQEACDAGMLYLLLTGGEIFVRHDFKEIYEEISRLGIFVQLYTNGTMITPEIARWLSKIPPSKVEVTLYGFSPESYEKVCGFSEGFARTVRGIELLHSAGIRVQLRTTVVQGNRNDFDSIADFAQKLGIEFSIVNYISPRREGFNTCPEAERLSPADIVEYEAYAYKYFKSIYPQSIHNDELTDKGKCDCEGSINTSLTGTKDPFFCTAGKSAFAITYKGNLTPCGLMDTPYTYPLNVGFNKAWTELSDQCFSLPICQECVECTVRDHCMSCPARLKNETGSYDKPALYLCESAKLRKVSFKSLLA